MLRVIHAIGERERGLVPHQVQQHVQNHLEAVCASNIINNRKITQKISLGSS